jgi:hypothetical protein
MVDYGTFKGEAGRLRHDKFTAPTRSFHKFFFIAALFLLAEYELQDQ